MEGQVGRLYQLQISITSSLRFRVKASILIATTENELGLRAVEGECTIAVHQHNVIS